MLYKRPQLEVLISRLGEPPRHLIAVSGPRQVGKTTLIELALNEIETPYQYVALDEQGGVQAMTREDDIAPYRLVGKPNGEWLIDVWHRARQEADRSTRGFVLVLDEIQKIEDWSTIVKGLWDRDKRDRRNMHVVISGSAPLLFHSGLNESLLGRFEVLKVPHWSFIEMTEAFGYTLDEYIYFGGYPSLVHLRNDVPRWREALVNTIITPEH